MRHFLLALATFMAMAGCEPIPSSPTDSTMDHKDGVVVSPFMFDSGGANHPEAFGAWQVRLDHDGILSLAHTRNDETVTYEPYELTDDQTERLWAVIDGLPFQTLARLAAESPAAIPGEPVYTFHWTADGREASASLPSTHALKHSGVVAMIGLLEPLIHEATGVEATLR